MYSQQVAKDWSEVFIFTLLLIINTIVLVFAIVFPKYKKAVTIPDWFSNIVALASISYATIGIINGIFSRYQTGFPLLISITAILFALGIWHGLKTKSGFYLSVIPLSLIIIVSALLIKISDGEVMFLLVSLFIIASVTLTIKNLINLQKKWKGVTVTTHQKNNDIQSLPMKILSVLGGILASLAFLGFLFMTRLYDSSIGLLICGIICIIGAIWISKKYDKIIIDTVSVSSFIIGFILLGFGLSRLTTNNNIVCVTFIIIAFSSLMIVRNYILSFVSILIISGSILTLIISNETYDLIHIYVSALALIITYFFLKEEKIITVNKSLSILYNPIRTGLIFSFLAGLAILGKKGLFPISPNYIWLSSLIIISAIVYLGPILFDILNITKIQHKIVIYILTVLVLLPTALSPAISGAILIILLSFLVNYKTGLVLGIVAFIYFISQYYYDLNFTLLTKSILLFSSGILFIVFYLFTHKKLTTNEKI